ncbi:MAG TPA: MiaB/RimO family radical SAM methylthiotransferase [Candidatus Saccharimonadales bacterium]|nr:MiaB/RimO family radical SAM methylthiotransferase [Candidatus Saccharimonadales bacterium]
MSAPVDRPLRVALTVLGCKVNFAEMADLAGKLAAGGCEVVPESESADVRVLNSCTVTAQADATTRQRIRRLRRFDPRAHLVLTGCSVDANPGAYTAVDSVFANRDKDSIAAHVLAMSPPAVRRGDAPVMRSRAFIKVQDGCDHRCTYCIVWQARGASSSVPARTVHDRVAAAIDAGHGELVLCGVDLGSYGRDIGTDLATLVASLLDGCGNGARIRLSSINANDVTTALIALNAHPRLCSHWHMPLQSGSDSVLRAMHRGYRRAQYLRVARALSEVNPATEFTTDIMVGFPGETEDDHAQTLSLVDEVGFLQGHVFRWSPRPGTPASALPSRVDDAAARRRSAEVRRATRRSGARSLARACGRVHEVAWDAVEEDTAHGLTGGYHEVMVEGTAGVRQGGLNIVRAETVVGDRLRCTLLRS